MRSLPPPRSSSSSQRAPLTLSIRAGFKEFAPYLSLAHSAPSPSSSSSSAPEPGTDASPAQRAAFDNAVRTMKTSTRQYAKRQVKWIRGKLLPAVRDEAARARAEGEGGEGDVVVVLLDATGALSFSIARSLCARGEA